LLRLAWAPLNLPWFGDSTSTASLEAIRSIVPFRLSSDPLELNGNVKAVFGPGEA